MLVKVCVVLVTCEKAKLGEECTLEKGCASENLCCVHDLIIDGSRRKRYVSDGTCQPMTNLYQGK